MSPPVKNEIAISFQLVDVVTEMKRSLGGDHKRGDPLVGNQLLGDPVIEILSRRHAGLILVVGFSDPIITIF